jgi:hypothetical protein
MCHVMAVSEYKAFVVVVVFFVVVTEVAITQVTYIAKYTNMHLNSIHMYYFIKWKKGKKERKKERRKAT